MYTPWGFLKPKRPSTVFGVLCTLSQEQMRWDLGEKDEKEYGIDHNKINQHIKSFLLIEDIVVLTFIKYEYVTEARRRYVGRIIKGKKKIIVRW